MGNKFGRQYLSDGLYMQIWVEFEKIVDVNVNPRRFFYYTRIELRANEKLGVDLVPAPTRVNRVAYLPSPSTRGMCSGVYLY